MRAPRETRESLKSGNQRVLGQVFGIGTAASAKPQAKTEHPVAVLVIEPCEAGVFDRGDAGEVIRSARSGFHIELEPTLAGFAV